VVHADPKLVRVKGLSFPNPLLRASFANPENFENVSVDLCEWCATLARSLFCCDLRLLALPHPTETLSAEMATLFWEAASRFRTNTLLCLNKTLLEQGYNLYQFCSMLSTHPMCELRLKTANSGFDQDQGFSQLDAVYDTFQNGASALDDVVDLYAFLTNQMAFLNGDKDSLDTQVPVKSVSWLRLIRESPFGIDDEGPHAISESVSPRVSEI